MRIVLVESAPDAASVGIAAQLRSSVPHRATDHRFDGETVVRFPGLADAHLVRTPQVHIGDETLDRRLRDAGLDPDLIVFLSKHRSESGRPTLTAHPVGNLGEARFGGQPRRLGPSLGAYLSDALRCLAQARAAHGFDAEVSFEATHHGPLLSVPSLFIELGSTAAEWGDPAGHRVLADAVRRLLSKPASGHPIVIGLGGGHYGPRFTEAVLSRRVNVAHIVPTYHAKDAAQVPSLAEEVVRASPGVSGLYYQDGTLPKAPREAWLEAFKGLGLPVVTSRDFPPLEEASPPPL